MYGDAFNDMEGCTDPVSTGVYEANNKVSLFSWEVLPARRPLPEYRKEVISGWILFQAHGQGGSEAQASEPAQPESVRYRLRTRRRQGLGDFTRSNALGYPDEQMLEVLPNWSPSPRLLRTSPSSQLLMRCRRAYLQGSGGRSLNQEYDLSRVTPAPVVLTDGDTRRRGETLLRFKQMYRDSGMLTVLNGELPDYLPLVLEFCALVDRRWSLGCRHRPSLDSPPCNEGRSLPHYGLLPSARPFPASLPRPRKRSSGCTARPVETVGLNGYADHQIPAGSSRSN